MKSSLCAVATIHKRRVSGARLISDNSCAPISRMRSNDVRTESTHGSMGLGPQWPATLVCAADRTWCIARETYNLVVVYIYMVPTSSLVRPS
jgi:hypothetical protein